MSDATAPETRSLKPADVPPRAYLYPLPYAWYEDGGIRRYGFHGTSHAYCTGRAAELLGRDVRELRLVICHLGQGSSATAVRGGLTSLYMSLRRAVVA